MYENHPNCLGENLSFLCHKYLGSLKTERKKDPLQ